MEWAVLAVLMAIPAAIAGVFGRFVPVDRPVARWRLALATHLELVAHLLRHRHPPPPDPFAALRVQERLGVVIRHVQSLEADLTVIARAERIIASQLAYDDLLAEACKMAGVDVQEHAKGDPAERFREEVELTERGWTW